MRKIIFCIIGFLVFSSFPASIYSKEAIKDTFNIRILQPDETNREPHYIEKAKGIDIDEVTGLPTVSPVAVLITDVIDFLIAVVGAVSLLIFIAGGLLLIVAEGQDDKIQKGKQAMVFSLIGLVVALMAYVITTAVQAIFF